MKIFINAHNEFFLYFTAFLKLKVTFIAVNYFLKYH